MVLLLGGSAYNSGPGRWSAAMEWLSPRLQANGYRTAQVRYPSRSWRGLGQAIEETRSALEFLPPVSALMGFSMGGSVAAAVAADSDAELVVGLAPWFPEEVALDGLVGRRLRVLHGSFDRPLPGIPGVHSRHSRAGVIRAKGLGVDAEHAMVPGGIHLIAFRLFGRLLPAPRAGRWLDLIRATLDEGQSA